MRVFSWVILVLVLIGAVLTVGAAAFTYANVRQLVADSPVELPELKFSGQATQVSLFSPTKTPAPTLPLPEGATAQSPAAEPTMEAWADPSRINILLLGIDQRKGEKGPFRTDTIMVLSLDPIRKTGAMLSIPRDIYLGVAGFKPDRINNMNAIGELANYPNGGGPALAVKAVQNLLGIQIQRYVMVNFDVFNTVIDAVGPINVCPEQPIHDNNYPDGSYGFITVDFPAGCQDLDSTKLLQYARVRHSGGDDFGRAARQQEVIRSVREKVLSLGGVSALIGKAGTLWGTVKDSIKTDLKFEEILQLAQVAQSIPKDAIKSAVLTDRDGYLLPATLPSGEQVFTPIYEKIHELVETLFDPSAAPSQAAVDTEGAKIVVSNGAGVDGMAKLTADNLKAKGFAIADVKNADLPGGYGKTVIRVFTGKVKVARALAEALSLDGTVIESATENPDNIDIEVIVGKDLVPKTP